MSQDASLVGYQAKPLEGDATLYLFQRAKSKLDSFQRGEGLRFNLNSDLAVFKITPGFDTLRTLKLKKVKKNQSAVDYLGMVYVGQHTFHHSASCPSRIPGWGLFLVEGNYSPRLLVSKLKASVIDVLTLEFQMEALFQINLDGFFF